MCSCSPSPLCRLEDRRSVDTRQIPDKKRQQPRQGMSAQIAGRNVLQGRLVRSSFSSNAVCLLWRGSTWSSKLALVGGHRRGAETRSCIRHVRLGMITSNRSNNPAAATRSRAGRATLAPPPGFSKEFNSIRTPSLLDRRRLIHETECERGRAFTLIDCESITRWGNK